MLHCRTLSNEERKELDEFLKIHKLEINVRTRRELTDVVRVAKIFKTIHPKLVDMHNYTPRNSLALKLQNWQTFNSKVLRKLGLSLSKSALEQLAAGVEGAIESLFYDLMAINKDNITHMLRSRPVQIAQSQQESRTPLVKLRPISISLTNVSKQILVEKIPVKIMTMDAKEMVNGKVVMIPKSVVAFEDYQAVLREGLEKDNYLNSVSRKVEYLESVIKIKDERIIELTEQLGRLSVNILSMHPKFANEDNDAYGNDPEPEWVINKLP